MQIELREIEEKIKKLHVEIENMKPKPINENQKKFLSIKSLAKQNPIHIESLNLSTKTQKALFVNVLAYIVSLESVNLYEKLLYLCRITNGCGLKLEAEEIYKGLKFEEQDVGRTSEELRDLRYVLLVEALVIANITGKASSVVLSEIAEIASLLNVNKVELQLISLVAKSKLSENLDLLNDFSISEVIALDNVFNDYIPKEWIEKQRVKCCAPICLEGYFNGQYGFSPKINYKTKIVQQQKNNNEIVRQGDLIFNCLRPIEKDARKKVNNSIKAPKNGKLFIIDYRVKSKVQNKNDTYRAVYVVSYYDNYKDFCEWIKAKIKFDKIVKKF